MPINTRLAVNQLEASIDECQRQCLLHVLRNFMTALSGAIHLIEDRSNDVSTEQLLACINNIPTRLKRVVESLDAGSFCPLISDECEFVGKFVGCNRSAPALKP